MPITLPREERFKNPAPQRVDEQHLRRLREENCRNAVASLQIQFLAHELMARPDYYRDLRRWPRQNIQRIRGMAFDGYHPLPEDLVKLEESLKGKDGPIHKAVRDFRAKVADIVEHETLYWGTTRWGGDALRRHQDTEAMRIVTERLAGRIAFFGSARLEEGSSEYEAARWLSRILVEHLAHDDGTSEEVVTGGGPGIMAAGNRGALEGSWNHLAKLQQGIEDLHKDQRQAEKAILTHRNRMQSIGIRIELPFETGWNTHLQLNLSTALFPYRKQALLHLASGEYGQENTPPDVGSRHPGFFVFKGGIGTRDEVWEVICLQQCGKMPPTPIFIVGDAECRMVERSMEEMEEGGTIGPYDRTLSGTGNQLLFFCKDEREAARKYLEWHNIDPPIELLREIKKREPSIRNGDGKNGKAKQGPVQHEISAGQLSA